MFSVSQVFLSVLYETPPDKSLPKLAKDLASSLSLPVSLSIPPAPENFVEEALELGRVQGIRVRDEQDEHRAQGYDRGHRPERRNPQPRRRRRRRARPRRRVPPPRDHAGQVPCACLGFGFIGAAL